RVDGGVEQVFEQRAIHGTFRLAAAAPGLCARSGAFLSSASGLSNQRHGRPLARCKGVRMAQRFALYYAPSINTSLWERASAWLGRDPATEASFEGAIAGIERAQLLNRTQSAHRYGFHATLKPPMRLAEGREPEALRAALARFAETAAPVAIGRLQVAELDGFLAL